MLAFLFPPSVVGYTSCTSLFRGSPCLLVRGFQEGPHLLISRSDSCRWHLLSEWTPRIQQQCVSFGAEVTVQSHIHVATFLSLSHSISDHTCSHARTHGGEPRYDSTKNFTSLIFVDQRLIHEVRENKAPRNLSTIWYTRLSVTALTLAPQCPTFTYM